LESEEVSIVPLFRIVPGTTIVPLFPSYREGTMNGTIETLQLTGTIEEEMNRDM